LQLFALFVRARGAGEQEARTWPRPYHAQAVVMYAVIGLTFVLNYVVGAGNTQVTDADGLIWHTGSIAESAAIVSIYTMLFVAALAAVKLIQGSTEAAGTPVAMTNGSATTDTFAINARQKQGVGGS